MPNRFLHCRHAVIISLLLPVLVLNTHLAYAHDRLHLGQPAPQATLVTLDGRHITTRNLIGQPVVLTFWASWCEPCRQELPVLSKFAAAHRQQGLRVLGFCLDDSDNMATVNRIAKQLSFPVGLLAQSYAHGYGRMWRIPVSFVIDRKGVLRFNGWTASQPAWTEASLDKVVGPLLKP